MDASWAADAAGQAPAAAAGGFGTWRWAQDYLGSKTNFERSPRAGGPAWSFKLDRMRALAGALGDPQARVPAIHVAGSKGKGSITRMAASVLAASGLKTGAYTSPHLEDVRERIAVDGRPISQGDLAAALADVARAEARLGLGRGGGAGEVTYFEAMTAAAFVHFARAARAAVYEVGLGGRLDATNVLTPAVCVLCSIELEHTAILGDTHEAIAREKAGILKPGVPAVCTPQREDVLGVFRERAAAVGCELLVLGEDLPIEVRQAGAHAVVDLVVGKRRFAGLRAPLPGAHQGANTAAAVAACALLAGSGTITHAITPELAARGLATTPRDGRMEVVATRPTVVVDGAHTPASVAAALASLASAGPPTPGRERTPPVIVFGCAGDKDAAGMLAAFRAADARLVTLSAGPRPRAADALADLYRQAGGWACAQASAGAALAKARALAGEGGLVLACGSFMVAGAVRAAARAAGEGARSDRRT